MIIKQSKNEHKMFLIYFKNYPSAECLEDVIFEN